MMLMLDADAVLNTLPFTTSVDGLADIYLKPIGLIDKLRVESDEASEEITLFKNGGGGHLDLMIARILHKHSQL